MYREIVRDYFSGLLFSCRFDLLLRKAYYNKKILCLIFKIVAYNFLLHIIPTILVEPFRHLFYISLFFNIINFQINLVSVLFHLIHYLDLLNIISTYSGRTDNVSPPLETMSTVITMSLYKFTIYLTTLLVNLILHERFFFVATCLNFVILEFYHSFYCYNNWWQHRRIRMRRRVDICEKMWPFYLGYGTFASIIYFYTSTPQFTGLYNLYITFLISNPFLMETKHWDISPSYPSINLSFFSYLTKFLFFLAKIIVKKFFIKDPY